MSNRIVAVLLAALVVAQPLGAAAQTELAPGDAVDRALRNNPSLAAALLSRRSAHWAVVGEDAAFSPFLQLNAGASHGELAALGPDGTTLTGVDTLSLGAGLVQRLRLGTDVALRVEHDTRWDQTENQVGLLAFGPVYDTSARLELTQPLLRGAGATVAEAALRAARAQESEAESAAAAEASQLVRDVLIGWWELWYADEALRIERQSLEVAAQQRDDTRRRIELGTEAPVAVLSFETRVAERMEGVATAERVRQERAVALAALLGDASQPVAVATPELGPVAAPAAATARQLAVEASPEVRQAVAAQRIAAIRAETAADPLRPRLDVQGFAEVGSLAPSFIGLGGEDGSQTAWSAGVNLIFEMPLDSRAHRAASEQARLSVATADRRVEQARLAAESSVEAELARIASANARVELAARTVEMAEAQLDAERKRFAIGTSTPTEVLQAEDAVRSARLRLARAEVDLRNADAAVEHITGGLLARWLPADIGAERPL